jgi:predicted NBD/HSP70 family sugar kinase
VSNLVCSVTAEINKGKKAKRKVQAIGIACPGYLDLRGGRVIHGVTNIPSGTSLREELVSNLRGKKNSPISTSKNAPKVDVFIDNDVRCAARAQLVDRGESSQWKDMVCLHIGSGIGAGIVLNGEVYYGPRSWSGEIGHVDLGASGELSFGLLNSLAVREASDATVLSADSQTLGSLLETLAFQPPDCSCGRSAFHFEALANYDGLQEWVRFCQPGKGEFEKLCAAFQTEWSDEQILWDGWPALVGGTGLPAVPVPQAVHDLLVAQAQMYQTWFKRTSKIYCGLVAGGICSLAKILDVNHVVMLGSLYSKLRNSVEDKGRSRFHRFLEKDVRRMSGPEIIEWCSVDSEPWRGAALLATAWSRSAAV